MEGVSPSLLDIPLPIGETVALIIIGGVLIKKGIFYFRGHDTNKTKSNKNKHEKGDARRQRDQGGEKKKQKKGWTPGNKRRE